MRLIYREAEAVNVSESRPEDFLWKHWVMHKQRAIEKQSVFLADSDKILTGSVAILVSVRKKAISNGAIG